jgi:hypothetical protein
LVNILLLLLLELFNKEEGVRVVVGEVVAFTSEANDADPPSLLVLSLAVLLVVAVLIVVVNAVDSCSIIGFPTTWTTLPFEIPYSINTFC